MADPIRERADVADALGYITKEAIHFLASLGETAGGGGERP